MPKRTQKECIEDAAVARTDLTIFYGVIALLEGGTISSDRYRTQQRIIKLCKDESAKCLRDYDRAVYEAQHG